ncbi:MAG: dihydrodipicolinate synthase family protein [Pirellulales bacterium]
MPLTRDTFTGPWAGLPVAWTTDDQFDEPAYRDDVARCCQSGVPGVYTGGTTGEFYAMEFDEFRNVARATIDECHAHGRPAMIGCTSTYTRGAVRRATLAAELGADAIQVALPYWMEIGEPEIVPFFKAIADAAGGLPLSIYDVARSKHTLSLDEHWAIREAVPSYAMVKATAGTVGATPSGCEALSEKINVFVGGPRWAELAPRGARGGCSSMVYWNPRLVMSLWSSVESDQWATVNRLCALIAALHAFLRATFGPKGFTDTAFDRLGGVACGFLTTRLRNRGPYPSATISDVQVLREWCREHFPEILCSDDTSS